MIVEWTKKHARLAAGDLINSVIEDIIIFLLRIKLALIEYDFKTTQQ
jgi:hypothetical protein